MTTEKDLTAYCGLYCDDCVRFNGRFSESAGALLKEIDTPVFRHYAVLAKLDGFEPAISLLKQLKGLACDQTCRQGMDGGGGGPCAIKQCVKEKTLEGCWECAEFADCRKMDFLKPFCGDRHIKNLQHIKQHGLDHWADHRENQYPWMESLK